MLLNNVETENVLYALNIPKQYIYICLDVDFSGMHQIDTLFKIINVSLQHKVLLISVSSQHYVGSGITKALQNLWKEASVAMVPIKCCNNERIRD